jgi:hypothetical protein
VIGSVGGALGVVAGFAKALAGGSVTLGLGGIGAGVAALLAVLAIIIIAGVDTCTAGSDDRVNECIAGVVNSVTPSFNSAGDQLFPFTAKQDEIDVVAKSMYWPIIEKSNAFVWCNTDITTNSDTDNSEIIRCYFYTPAVCNAVIGSAVGAAVLGAAALYPAALVVIAIGCATFWGCLIALLVAALIVAAAALIGALAGGQIAKSASSGSVNNTSAGNFGTISVGDLITCTGPLIVRGDDNNANVFWWVTSFSLSGTISGTKPFRYCDVDTQFTMDSCNTIV